METSFLIYLQHFIMTSLQLPFHKINEFILGIQSTKEKEQCLKEKGCVRANRKN